MKVMTIFGTRPEIVRLSRILPALDRHSTHVMVHTGQNYDDGLSGTFFRDLDLRDPDEHLGAGLDGFGAQAGAILARAEEVLLKHAPDRVVILGDTNSGLSAVVAARLGIPVFHLEAGNRCYDDRVPEEINRRIIDHCSRILMPYTVRSQENLVREGIPRDRIFVVGNPIREVLDFVAPKIDRSDVLERLSLREREYFLVTLHRAENVDIPSRLASLVEGLMAIRRRHGQPVVVSVHPRTADRLARFDVKAPDLTLLSPLPLTDFVKLERHARAVLSDSGTVQEECALLGVPSVTLRDVTERPETIECGSAILSGGGAADIVRALDVALDMPTGWTPPVEYLRRDVSTSVVKIVLGYSLPCRRADDLA
jgi:UDP-N-acetylglucosamine 2-epimerase (non-hydrolysing)